MSESQVPTKPNQGQTMAPIQITLYDPETDEVKKKYSRNFVPWRVLKAAMRLAPKLNAGVTEETADELAGLVTEVFGNAFSIQDLNDGADLGDMVAVIVAVMERASSMMPRNPTLPGR